GVVAETRLAPQRVRRFAARAPSLASAAQCRKMPIADARVGERPVQRLAVELRMAAREGKAPDVGDGLDGGAAQQRDEVAERARRMPDGENRHTRQPRLTNIAPFRSIPSLRPPPAAPPRASPLRSRR